MSNCSICSVILDDPKDLTTEDCGGDCLYCMYESGDPDATMALVKIYEKEIVELKKKLKAT